MKKGTFGKILKERMAEEKFTFRALARKLHITAGVIFRYEKGHSYPSPRILANLCEIFSWDFKEKFALIQAEKDPKSKSYFSQEHNADYFYEAKSLSAILELDGLFDRKKYPNINLLSSFVFKIRGDFLYPLVNNGQRAIISFCNKNELGKELTVGEYFIGTVACNTKNQSQIEKFISSKNIITKKGPEHLTGKIISIDTKQIKICNLKSTAKSIGIVVEDVEIAARIIGILF